jgi:hypothetical protein
LSSNRSNSLLMNIMFEQNVNLMDTVAVCYLWLWCSKRALIRGFKPTTLKSCKYFWNLTYVLHVPIFPKVFRGREIFPTNKGRWKKWFWQEGCQSTFWLIHIRSSCFEIKLSSRNLNILFNISLKFTYNATLVWLKP